MKDRFYNFMAGRNGVDQLSRTLTIVSVILIILRVFIRNEAGSVLSALGLALLIYAYFRMFSRNVYQRRTENYHFCRFWLRISNGIKDRLERLRQSRDYRFFRCPSCTAMLRVPRGKGRIRVTCRKCGTSFERKS